MSSQELVKEAFLLLTSSDDSGISYQDHNLFKVYSDILSNLFDFNNEVPTEVKRSMMNRCILSMARSGENCESRLENMLLLEEKSYLKQSMSTFILLSSVSIKHDPKIGRIKTPKASFTFTSNRPRAFHLPDGGSFRVGDSTPSGFSYVKVHVKARDQWGAAEVAMNSLDLMRSIWNLYFNRQTYARESFPSNGGWKPVNKILPGPIHTLHTSTGALALREAWWNTYMPQEISPLSIGHGYSDLKRFERYVRKQIERCTFGHKIERFLIRYAKALDPFDSTTTMLNLWSTLEEIAGVKGQANSNKMIKRVIFLDRNPKQGRLLLEFIREHRNTIAHDGTTPQEIERLIYILKRYVEGLLLFVVHNAPKYSNHEQLLHVLDLPLEQKAIHSDMQRLRAGLRLRIEASS